MMNVYMGTDVEEFIFGESGYDFEDTEFEVTDEELNAEGVIECFDDPDVACYRIALENEQNYNAVLAAINEQEIYSEGVKDTAKEVKAKAAKYFAWIKKMVEKFWAKVQGVFKKVMDTINSFVLSNKAFVKKYRPVASQIKTPAKSKDFKGFNFPASLDINYATAAKTSCDRAKGLANSVSSDKYDKFKSNDSITRKEYIENVLNAVRSDLVGNGTTADNFDEKIRTKLYGSIEPVSAVTIKGFNEYLNSLETAAQAKKDAKNGYKEAQKSVKTLLSTVKESTEKYSKAEDKDRTAEMKMIGDSITRTLTIMSTALSYHTRAIVAKAQQDRKIANWFVANRSVKESVEFDDIAFV